MRLAIPFTRPTACRCIRYHLDATFRSLHTAAPRRFTGRSPPYRYAPRLCRYRCLYAVYFAAPSFLPPGRCAMPHLRSSSYPFSRLIPCLRCLRAHTLHYHTLPRCCSQRLPACLLPPIPCYRWDTRYRPNHAARLPPVPFTIVEFAVTNHVLQIPPYRPLNVGPVPLRSVTTTTYWWNPWPHLGTHLDVTCPWAPFTTAFVQNWNYRPVPRSGPRVRQTGYVYHCSDRSPVALPNHEPACILIHTVMTRLYRLCSLRPPVTCRFVPAIPR